MDNKLIPFIVLVMFSFVGLVLTSTFFHEYVHYIDFNKIALDEEFCVLNYDPSWESSIGYYAFNYNLEDEHKIDHVRSETKAYVISILIILVWCYAVGDLYFKYKYQI